MILSFAWTTEAFLQGKKTVTRRFYGERQVKLWQSQWDKGNRTHKAYDKDVRAKGRHIGWFRLTERPYLERLGDMPESDLAAEGGLWETLEDFRDGVAKGEDAIALVIRFEKVDGGSP